MRTGADMTIRSTALDDGIYVLIVMVGNGKPDTATLDDP